MILNDNQIKEIISRETADIVEWLDIIRAYIFEKKGVDVGQIQYPDPRHPMFNLYMIAQETVFNYYAKKLLR